MIDRDDFEDALARVNPAQSPFSDNLDKFYEKKPRKWWQFWKPKYELVRKPGVTSEWQTEILPD